MKNSETILFAETSTANIVTSLSVASELASIVAVFAVTQSNNYITPDSSNPLQGTYSNELSFEVQNATGQAKTFTISNPKFIRKSPESSTWELDPQLKEEVLSNLLSKEVSR
jgi:hypothetical protein